MNIFVVLTLNKFFKPLNIKNIIKQKIKIINSEGVLFFLNSIISLKGLFLILIIIEKKNPKIPSKKEHKKDSYC